MNEETNPPIESARIEAVYSQHLAFDIGSVEENLNIKWEDVATFEVQPLLLVVTMKDGRVLEYVGGLLSPPALGRPDVVFTHLKDGDGNLVTNMWHTDA